MRRILCALVLVLSSLATTPAEAGSCDRPLVSACLNSDTLWPTAGPSRFATLGSTQTVAPGAFAAGLVASYLQRPVVLAVPSPGPTGTQQSAVADQVNGTFLFGYGVTSRLALDVALPVTFGQGGSGTAAITGGDDLRDTALRDMRFGVSVAAVPEARIDPAHAGGADELRVAATGHFAVSAPTGDRTQFAGERGAVLVPSFTVGATYNRFFAGLDVGARLRGISQFSGARVGSQLTVGVGAGATILPHDLLRVSLEARALPTLTEQHDTVQTASGLVSTPNGERIIPAEWMLAVASAPVKGGDFVITGGGGTGIPLGGEAVTRPRLRFLLGVAYAPRGLDSDGDGVLDKDDGCPGLAGVRTIPENVPDAVREKAKRGCPLPAGEDAPVDFSAPGRGGATNSEKRP